MEPTSKIFHYGQVVLLYTHDLEEGLHGREMTIFVRPQDKEVIWFATARISKKVKEIEKDNRIILSYKDPYKRKKVILLGTAEIVDDLSIKKDLWRDQWQIFWPQGVLSKNLTLLKITVNRSEN
ncbi:MAG: pyridoxamine 5'-phosphate oxidase family protein [Promethearchaeota archaeon]